MNHVPGMDEENVIYAHTHIHARTRISFRHKSKGILPFMTIWMDVDDVILSEISEKEQDKNRLISLICGTQKNK